MRTDSRLHFFVRKVFRQHHFCLDLAVYLYSVFHFVFHERALIKIGVAFVKHGVFIAADFPQFFGEVGGKGCEHTHEIECARFVERHVLICHFAVVFLHCVHVFHKTGYGRIEREYFHVARDVFNGVMLCVVERFFRRRNIRACAFFVHFVRFQHDTFHTIGEFCHRFDTVVAPRAAFGIAKPEHQVQTEHIRTVFVDIRIGGNDVPVRFGHTVAVRAKDNALVHQTLERFVEIDVAHIAQRFRDKTCVQKVHTCVFRTAYVHVNGEHFVRDFRRERVLVVVRFGVAEIIPAGTYEGVQRIGITGSFAAALRTSAVHKSFVTCKGGASRGTEFYVVGELYRQILFRNGNCAAFFTINHRDRRAPITLTGYRPVAQTVIYLSAAFADLGKVDGNCFACVVARQTVKRAAVDQNTVFGIGQGCFAAHFLDNLRDGQTVFFCESIIAFVVRCHRHHCARAVRIQNVIGKVDGYLFTRKGVCRIRAGERTRLFACRRKTVDIVCFSGILYVCVDVFRAFGMRRFQFFHQGVFGSKHNVVNAEYRIGTCRKHGNIIARFALKMNFTARRFPDPVLLHQFRLFRPIDSVEIFQQLFRVIGDFQEPLRHILTQNGRATAFTLAADNLFVRKDGFTGRAPVHECVFAISQTFFIQLYKQPLRPLIIILVAGDHFRRPVEHSAHIFELLFHCFDVLLGGVLGMNTRFDGVVFRRQTERVKPHRLEHFVSLHLLKACIRIGRAVVIPMPDVQLCARGIGEHFQNVELFIHTLFVKNVLFALLPSGLPFAFNRFHIHNRKPPSAHTRRATNYRKFYVFIIIPFSYYKTFFSSSQANKQGERATKLHKRINNFHFAAYNNRDGRNHDYAKRF